MPYTKTHKPYELSINCEPISGRWGNNALENVIEILEQKRETLFIGNLRHVDQLPT